MITNSFVSSYAANCLLLHVCQLFNISQACRKGVPCALLSPDVDTSQLQSPILEITLTCTISNVLLRYFFPHERVLNKGFILEAIISLKIRKTEKKAQPTSGETPIIKAEIFSNLEL